MFSTVLLAVGLVVAAPLAAGDSAREITVGATQRNYLVHIPPQAAAGKPLPVVLVFHGAMSNAQQTVRYTGLNEKADRAGFIAVYPNGTGRFERVLIWNAGNCCGRGEREGSDDVAFIEALLDELATETKIDPKRVFATGISNGAMMCYRLADVLSDRIAAIAPVSGPMGGETCNPRRPVSVIYFHGTADPFVPFLGGRGDKSLPTVRFFSVEHSVKLWVQADGCPAQPTVTQLPQKVADGTSVTRKVYGPGKQGAEVVLYEIEGGGHTWPGRPLHIEFLGKATQQISANDLMWDFFVRHPRQ
jgi:polyhydroxybutyrate depolymerase